MMKNNELSLPYSVETPSFSLNVDHCPGEPDRLIVTITGSVANDEARIIQEQVPGFFSSSSDTQVVVDLAQIIYISSSGIGALLELLQAAEQKGISLHLSGVNPRIRMLFSALGLESCFVFRDSEG